MSIDARRFPIPSPDSYRIEETIDNVVVLYYPEGKLWPVVAGVVPRVVPLRVVRAAT